MTTISKQVRTDSPESQRSVRAVAVIDVGTSAIRMAVAEIDDDGRIRPLDTLSRAVNLGRDSFTKGAIGRATIEQCAEILRDCGRVLRDYDVVAPGSIRVVATTAVREAENMLFFLDRMFIASGLRVETIDVAEIHRLTWLSVQPLLDREAALARGETLVVEVGGGTTEMILLEDGNVASSHAYRLGALRLPEVLKALRAPAGKSWSLIDDRVQRTVERIRRDIHAKGTPRLVALGGDARFAADRIDPEWRSTGICRIAATRLESLVNDILTKTVDDLVASYRLTYQDAETLGTALLTYLQLGRTLGVDEMLVSPANLRDGLLMEMAAGGTWTSAFSAQIERSAVELGRRYRFDEAHGLHTADLAQTLFRALQEWHGLDPRFELLLRVAAILHDVGVVVSARSHHKHSMYLIQNSELFGLGQKDLLLVALIARYHRRATPRPLHEGYATLDMDSRVAVTKLAALLRIADALDRSDMQRVKEMHCAVDGDRLIIDVSGADDLTFEEMALRQKGALFQDVFGLKIHLRQS